MYLFWFRFLTSELRVPVKGICHAYPCHNFFLFREMRPANEIQPVDFCIPLHNVHQPQQDLFATGRPRALLPAAFDGVADAVASAAQASSGDGPQVRGPPARGQPT